MNYRHKKLGWIAKPATLAGLNIVVEHPDGDKPMNYYVEQKKITIPVELVERSSDREPIEEEPQRDWIDEAYEEYKGLITVDGGDIKPSAAFHQAIEKHQPPQLLPLDVEKIMREISINSYRDSPTENNVVTVYGIRGILSKYGTQQVTREEIEKLAVGKSVIIPDSLGGVARGREKLLEIPKVIDLLRSKGILKE